MKEHYPDIPEKTYKGSIPIAHLIELRSKGLTFDEIAKIVGRCKQTVHERLQPYDSYIKTLKTFKNNRADIFAMKQYELVDSLTPEVIKDMSGLQRITGMGILYDKERIESNKSTSNILFADIRKDEEEKNKLVEQLEAERAEIIKVMEGGEVPES